jgi:hypothetical protein
MSATVPRTRITENHVVMPPKTKLDGSSYGNKEWVVNLGPTTSTLVESEGHPINRKTGKRDSGGPFFVTHTEHFAEPGSVHNAVGGTALDQMYSGPVVGACVLSAAVCKNHESTPAPRDDSALNALGATAISQTAPTNPTASLATGLAESVREGIPTLPGIQLWRKRTEALKAVGSEYLNYQFGWAPLAHEVNETVKAALFHRDIMQNYRHNEGSNIHRRFDFPDETQHWDEEISSGNPNEGQLNGPTWFPVSAAKRVVRVEKTRKRWFEGCFTYGGPSKTDSFGRAIGFGSEADAVYGLELTPDVLWELTPWSWAVDWFTNTGDVINNVTNFALAGLVMRYGYMMEETISTLYTEYNDATMRVLLKYKPNVYAGYPLNGISSGVRTIRRGRVPANPFGFGIGWEGLSPTQLAITAAIGITRLL